MGPVCLLCGIWALFGAEINNSSVSTVWQDFPWKIDDNSWAEGRFCAVYRMAGPLPPPAAAPASDQHLQMAEAIVIGMKGATAAEKESKE